MNYYINPHIYLLLLQYTQENDISILLLDVKQTT